MNITVIGLGYVGLTNTVLLGSFGHNVIGFDVDKEKISLLKQGVATIEEPEIQNLLTESRSHLRFTSNAKDAIRQSNMFSICVDTPQGKNGEPDLSHYYEALDAIAENATQNCCIFIRSTVPVGTNKLTKKYLEEHSKFRYQVISLPEFLSQGKAVHDSLNPSRMVIGIDSPEAETFVKTFVGLFLKKIPLVITSPENAELIKYASNAFLAMKVSYINSISRLCDQVGGNIDVVARGMELDPRIGGAFLKAGIGYGGSCFPKDTNGLYWTSDKNSTPLKLVRATIEENELQGQYFLDKIAKRFKSVNNTKIAVFGVGFKGGTEDVRNSPAIPIIKALLEKGAHINLYDPLAEDNFHKLFSRHTHISYMNYPEDALKNADFVLILNDSEEFKNMTAQDYINAMKRPIIFDGRNLYKLDDMVGTEYYSIGRPDVKKKK